ncbi:MAG: AAA family ATPase [Polyangiaceae bacterium]|nr:AAA family ATPase [Polyangiaceae bacterium]
MSKHVEDRAHGSRVEIHRGPRFVLFRIREPHGRTRIHKAVRPGPRAPASTAKLEHELAMLRDLLEVEHIARPITLEPVQGRTTLVLRDAGPRDLKEVVRNKPLGLDDFLRIAIQLAGTVGHVHARHIIHRDINPCNVVVSADLRRATLIDFGLATHVAGSTQREAPALELEGTLLYIAPEQTGRMSRPVDHRADLYSLGATFYEMLTGAPPFVSTDPVELVHAHLATLPVPPREVNEAVPKVLSDLVMKLLAKTPEQRYQTAEALVADLEEAQRRWEASRSIDEFELARLDVARQLLTPGKLYGRDAELQTLRDAWERVRSGAREVIFIGGTAGIGKSSLMRALLPMFEATGAVLAGRFDPLHGNTPYAPIVDAVRAFVLRTSNEPPAVSEEIGRRIAEALGANAGLMTELFPDLEQLIGSTTPVADVNAAAAEHRFDLTFTQLVQAFATEDKPLVLFLDDLQWADTASLKALRLLATQVDLHHVLLVCAYRSDEIGADHPVRKTLDLIAEARGESSASIELAPLDVVALTGLASDMLRCSAERARPLAEIVHDKTAGNPFFVERFLRFVQRSGLLTFDFERSCWDWDTRRIAKLEVTENVAELMVAAIREMPARTQALLEVAACLPDQIDLGLLATVAGVAKADAARDLWPALHAGLLVSELTPAPASLERPTERHHPTAVEARYSFIHDRVRQAAYSLLTPERAGALHRATGWQLLEGKRGRALEERLFGAVDLLNRGADGAAGEERWRIVELDLRAGQKARAASAFGPALAYLAHGMDLLPPDAWQSLHALTMALHRHAAESAYLCGELALANAIMEAALDNATTSFEKAELCVIRVEASNMRLAFADALRWGREGLLLLGTELPRSDEVPAAFGDELDRLSERFHGYTMETLLNAPETREPAILLAMRLLASSGVAAYSTGDLMLASLTSVRESELTLIFGTMPESPLALVYYGVVVAEAIGDRARGYALACLGLELARKYRDRDPSRECRALLTFAALVSPWHEPMRVRAPMFQRTVGIGLEGGDLQGAIWGLQSTVAALWAAGAPLGRVHNECGAAIAHVRKLRQPWAVNQILPYRQATRCLQGRTNGSTSIDDDDFDERAFRERSRDEPHTLFLNDILRLQTLYLLGAYDLAEERIIAANEVPALQRVAIVVEQNLYSSLTYAAIATTADPAQRSALLARISANQEQIAQWALDCPENFRHKHRLVAAEIARLEARSLGATLELYDQAIEGARDEGFLQDEAVAAELAGRCCVGVGRRPIGAFYLLAAIDAYDRWGASAKVDALEGEFREIVKGVSLPRATMTPVTADSDSTSIDLLNLLEAAETISSEVVLDRLLEKLLGVCLATAGATHGALVLNEGGTFQVRAAGAVSEPVVLERIPLRGTSRAPVVLVEEVFRAGEPIVLADASRHARFGHDRYIAEHGIKSALGIPIRRKDATIGVLYLENRLATRAFTSERVRVLEALSSQIGISLENSRLFEAQRREEASARFLAEASAVLAESLDYTTTLSKVARLAVPALADWCTVDLVDREGNAVAVAAAHADPTKETVLRELRQSHRFRRDKVPSGLVLSTGEPRIETEITEAMIAEIMDDPRQLDLVHELGLYSAIAVPLRARGRTLGAITFASSRTDKHYTERDLPLFQELARRASAAIDNAVLYREAEDAIRLRDEFLQVASHELRTPITSLQLTVQHLVKHAAESPPETVARALATVERQGWKLAELIAEMLDVSRMQNELLKLSFEPVDLADLVRTTTAQLKDGLNRAQCAVTVTADSPVVGRWDRAQLERVVTNLLSNAMRFGAGKPIEVAVEERDGHARLVVVDHGIGIEPERLPYIFERFVRGVSATHYGGLGLGLYIVRAIVSALGGKVSAESKLGEGATFVVELPL